MKAVIASQQGDPGVLQVVDLPRPRPRPGQALVRVHASGVNHIDTKVRRARLPMTPAAFPAVLQGDFAGVVEEVADGSGRFQVGDEVFGLAGGLRGVRGDIPGTLSEYIAVDAELIALKPRSLGFREAAALPLVALTALLGLRHKVRLKASDTVLVHGGTGGVGQMAVQLARVAGARVFATVRGAENCTLVRDLGADVAIDVQSTPLTAPFEPAGDGFDVIFDTVGGAVLDQSFGLVRPGGDVVTVVGAASHNLAPLYLRGGNLHTVLVLIPQMFGRDREQQGLNLDRIRHLADTGRLRPLLDPQRFTLEQAADAHRKLEAGAATGKLVVDIG